MPLTPTTVPTQQGIDRRRMLAEALAKVGQQGTGLSGPWGPLASLLTGGISGWQSRKAGNEQTTLDDDKKAKIAAALSEMAPKTRNPAAIGVIGSLPLEQQQQVAGQIALGQLKPASGDGFTLSPGQQRFGADGKPVAQVAPEQDAFTLNPGQQRFNPDGTPIAAIDPALEKTDVGGKVVFTDSKGQPVSSLDKGVSPDAQLSSETTVRGQDVGAGTVLRGQNMTAATAARGQDVTMRGQDISAETARTAAGNKGLTEQQGKVGQQLTRMTGAEKNIGAITEGGFSPGFADKLLDNSPGGLNNVLTSTNYQKYKQAANEWIAGLLRLDSGAAVPETEFGRYFQTWFPQPGEPQEVIAQKAESRQRAMEGMRLGLPQHLILAIAEAGSGAPGATPATPPPGNTGGATVKWDEDPRAAGALKYLPPQ